MRITDVKVTVWKWKDIPIDPIHTSSQKLGNKIWLKWDWCGSSPTKVLRGMLFLAMPLATLGNDGRMVVDRFKPMLVGRDPLAREQIFGQP